MKNKVKLSAIILSAGYSSRMGELKPLMQFGNKYALELLVETYIKSKIDDIIVVVGYRAADIMDCLKHLKVKWVVNPKYDEGMYSSIKAAVMELDEDSTGFFINPVDVPIIKTSTIESLKREFIKAEKGIVYPLFYKEKGHPPIIAMKYKQKILDNSDSGGLKNLLELYNDDSIEIPVCDNGILIDMDTPTDYQKLKEYFSSKAIPNNEECNAIFEQYKLPLNIIKHCKAVANIAGSIGEKLLAKGIILDVKRLNAAALLHDIGRMQKQHAKAGQKILKVLGYDEIADIISVHMDIEIKNNIQITESEIVYIADKLVIEDKNVTLEERFKSSFDEYERNSKVYKKIQLRQYNAKMILNKINMITGENFK
jgi:molybdenum cofactor cytidylyltransferase